MSSSTLLPPFDELEHDPTRRADRADTEVARPLDADRTVLFLCTGNFYRSRFAEELFNAWAPGAVDAVAISRGLALDVGVRPPGPMSAIAIEGLEQRGVQVRSPRSPMLVRPDELAVARRVIALHGKEHLPLVEQRFPDWLHRVEFWDVPDVKEMEAAPALMRTSRLVRELLDELAHELQLG